MSIGKLSGLLCVVIFLALPLNAFAQAPAFFDQVIDFENMATEGFVIGVAAENQPVVVTDATGNNVLQLQTNGNAGGAGSALLAMNNSLTGDFSSAGSITFDAINPNPVDLNIRFGFTSTGTSPAVALTNAFASNDIVLTAGTSQNLTFNLNPIDFTTVLGNDTFSNGLTDVTQIRILHNPIASGGGVGAVGAPVLDVNGSPIVATLQIDNFQVVSAVPEPSCLSLLLGLGGVLAFRRRR